MMSREPFAKEPLAKAFLGTYGQGKGQMAREWHLLTFLIASTCHGNERPREQRSDPDLADNMHWVWDISQTNPRYTATCHPARDASRSITPRSAAYSPVLPEPSSPGYKPRYRDSPFCIASWARLAALNEMLTKTFM